MEIYLRFEWCVWYVWREEFFGLVLSLILSDEVSFDLL